MGTSNTPAIKPDFDYNLGYASKATMTINSDLLYNMTEKDLNGPLPENNGVMSDFYYYSNYTGTEKFTDYFDRLVLPAMADVTLKANIAYVNKLPQGIRCGLCALVGGYDDASTFYSN